jgi:hypothetical protein
MVGEIDIGETGTTAFPMRAFASQSRGVCGEGSAMVMVCIAVLQQVGSASAGGGGGPSVLLPSVPRRPTRWMKFLDGLLLSSSSSHIVYGLQ